MQKEVFIVKAGGERERFNPEKLLYSLEKAGANREEARRIALHIEKEMRDGMRTSDVYEKAFSELRKVEASSAGKYSLRRALAELGPTGFPFEHFVAELMKARGYDTELNVIGRGKCIEHELDVVAWKGGETIAIEAKFHHELGIKTDVKVALYVKARFEDLFGKPILCKGDERPMTSGILLTNTKFTENAIRYSKCAGLNLIGWNYPDKGNLHHLIEELGLHPITTLPSLSGHEKRQFAEAGIVLCKHVREKKEALASLGLPEKRELEIISESNLVCPI
jgi:hypothetical protein